MRPWEVERRADLVRYLSERGLVDHAPFWKLAQALFEVLPRGKKDWKRILVSKTARRLMNGFRAAGRPPA